MTIANDPAFPIPVPIFDNNEGGGVSDIKHVGGLTKRELFAAMAMQCFVATGRCGDKAVVARWSVEFADALFAELEKGASPNA